jgi:hypothetical protein
MKPLSVSGSARGDTISYLRFEEGSGWFTADQTGLIINSANKYLHI